MKRAVRVIETILERSGDGQESTVILELLRMVGFEANPFKVNGTTPREEFIGWVLDGDERYIHVTAHGSGEGFSIHGDRHVPVTAKHFGDAASSRNRPLNGRFMTVSACGEPTSKFWVDLHEATGLEAVVAPMGKVAFDEAAVFYTSFYFALLRLPSTRRKEGKDQRLFDFIDTFQRAKVAYLGLGGCGTFRLIFWWEGEMKEIF